MVNSRVPTADSNKFVFFFPFPYRLCSRAVCLVVLLGRGSSQILDSLTTAATRPRGGSFPPRHIHFLFLFLRAASRGSRSRPRTRATARRGTRMGSRGFCIWEREVEQAPPHSRPVPRATTTSSRRPSGPGRPNHLRPRPERRLLGPHKPDRYPTRGAGAWAPGPAGRDACPTPSNQPVQWSMYPSNAQRGTSPGWSCDLNRAA